MAEFGLVIRGRVAAHAFRRTRWSLRSVPAVTPWLGRFLFIRRCRFKRCLVSNDMPPCSPWKSSPRSTNRSAAPEPRKRALVSTIAVETLERLVRMPTAISPPPGGRTGRCYSREIEKTPGTILEEHAGHVLTCVPMSRRFELVSAAAIKRRVSATRYRRVPSTKAKILHVPLVLVVQRSCGGI
jgi:hypothetical protein